MKLRLEDTDGKLITFADAPDDLPLGQVEWDGHRFRPFGTMRTGPDAVIANYRRQPPPTETELERLKADVGELRPAPAFPITDPNTPRRKP